MRYEAPKFFKPIVAIGKNCKNGTAISGNHCQNGFTPGKKCSTGSIQHADPTPIDRVDSMDDISPSASCNPYGYGE